MPGLNLNSCHITSLDLIEVARCSDGTFRLTLGSAGGAYIAIPGVTLGNLLILYDRCGQAIDKVARREELPPAEARLDRLTSADRRVGPRDCPGVAT